MTWNSLGRKILLQHEAHERGHAPRLEIEGYTNEQIGFHVHLMGQAGLLTVADITTLGDNSPSALPIAITWSGYEFLDAARNESLWKKAMQQWREKGVGLPFDLLKLILIELGKQQLGLSTTN